MDLILHEFDVILLPQWTISLILTHLVHPADNVLVLVVVLHSLWQVILFRFVNYLDCGHIGFIVVIECELNIIRQEEVHEATLFFLWKFREDKGLRLWLLLGLCHEG